MEQSVFDIDIAHAADTLSRTTLGTTLNDVAPAAARGDSLSSYLIAAGLAAGLVAAWAGLCIV